METLFNCSGCGKIGKDVHKALRFGKEKELFVFLFCSERCFQKASLVLVEHIFQNMLQYLQLPIFLYDFSGGERMKLFHFLLMTNFRDFLKALIQPEEDDSGSNVLDWLNIQLSGAGLQQTTALVRKINSESEKGGFVL